MRHRKKNLTLAKTLSVHKLNCALQRKSQLIGSFASDKKSPKLCHREKLINGCSYCLRNWHFEFSPGSNTTITSKNFGTIQKKLTQKQQKQKPVHLVSKIEIRNMTSMGEKMITLQHSTKATMPNIHNFSSDKTIFFLDRKVYGQIISSVVHSHKAN